MEAFTHCPVCGGELTTKKVEKILKGGNHTAVLTVDADVCLGCGERLYDQALVQHFEKIRSQLEHQQTQGFKVIGQTFQVA